MKHFRISLTAIVAVSLVLYPVLQVRADSTITVPLHKYARYCGVNIRIDKIDAYPVINPAVGVLNKALADNLQQSAKGFIVVHARVQNPGSVDIEFPNYDNFNFELSDGNQYLESHVRIYREPSLVAIPNTADSISLHPKQALNVAFVAANWAAVRPTKMFIQANSDCPNGWPSETRTILGKNDVTIHKS